MFLLFPPEEFGIRQGENENSPRSWEIKLRKNEIKLRKKDFEGPKNFSVSPWTFQDLHGGISRFPSPPDFFSPKSHFALPKNQKNIHEDIEHISVDVGFYRDRVSALVA